MTRIMRTMRMMKIKMTRFETMKLANKALEIFKLLVVISTKILMRTSKSEFVRALPFFKSTLSVLIDTNCCFHVFQFTSEQLSAKAYDKPARKRLARRYLSNRTSDRMADDSDSEV